MSSSRLQDLISDVFMDIGLQFYPLPIVIIPDLSIHRPNITQYGFANERKAVNDYEENCQNRKKSEHDIGSKSLLKNCSQIGRVAGLAKAPSSTNYSLNKLKPDEILQPSLASLSNIKKLEKTTEIVDSLEEFEAKPNLFDLVEMNTIDDKVALEQILNSVPNSITNCDNNGVLQSTLQCSRNIQINH